MMQDAQLAGTVGADPFGGLNVEQARALMTGAVAGADDVNARMREHSQRSADATRAGMQAYTAWNPQSRAAYPNARYDEANFSYQMRQARAGAEYERRDRILAENQIRQEAQYENRDRDLAQKRMHRLDYEIRQEAEYENRDREFAERKRRRDYNEMRQEAEYENRDRDRAYRKAYADAKLENEIRDREIRSRDPRLVPPGGGPPPGGGGGGGGDDDDRRRRGPTRIPFAGEVGLSRTAGALTKFFPRLGIPAAIAGAMEELFFLPQEIGSLMGGALQASTPYMNLVKSNYGFARNIGMTGEQALRGVFPGGFEAPPWMRALGLGPQQATDIASRFGILQYSEQQREGLVSALEGAQYIPGLGGIGPQIQRSARQAAIYGAIEPGVAGTRDYIMQTADAMETAIAKGMDRATILQSIDASVAMAARAGALGVSATGLQDFLFRFSNLPGGRTGEVGLSALSGLQGAMGTIGRDPMRTMMATTMAEGIRSRGDLARVLGPDNFAAISSTPEGQHNIRMFFQARQQGDTFGMSKFLDALMVGNPQAQMRLLSQSQFVQNLPEPLQDIAVANLMNLPLSEYTALKMNPRGIKPGAMGPHPITGGAAWEGSKGADYRAGLLRMGVRPDLVTDVLTQAAMAKINPLLVGAFMMVESSGGYSTKQGAYGMAADVNVMQIAGSSNMPKPGSAAESIRLGVRHLQHDIGVGGEDLDAIARSYAGNETYNAAYRSKLIRSLSVGGMGGDDLTGMLGTEADVRAAQMTASAASFNEMNMIVPLVSAGLAGLVRGFREATDAATKFARRLGGGAGPTSTYNPGTYVPQDASSGIPQ